LVSSPSRARLASKSKIPPQFGGALLEIVERLDQRVDAFGFHVQFLGYPSLQNARHGARCGTMEKRAF
jgi:hypothetical protein